MGKDGGVASEGRRRLFDVNLCQVRAYGGSIVCN